MIINNNKFGIIIKNTKIVLLFSLTGRRKKGERSEVPPNGYFQTSLWRIINILKELKIKNYTILAVEFGVDILKGLDKKKKISENWLILFKKNRIKETSRLRI